MWKTPDPDRFVVGVNLPWVGYGTDVGSSQWFPEGGFAARPEPLDALDAAFAAIARDGITVARLFLLCDARSGVRFDDGGLPLGLDATVLADVEAMLAVARRYQVGVIPVLLDFHLCGAREMVNGVQLGGRSHLIADPDAGARLIDRVLRPIVERFAADEAIVAWDVINEPEWCLRGGLFRRRTSIAFDAMQRFLGSAVQAVQQLARQPVTVGSAGTWALDLVRPLGLDFYQIHWYEKFGWPALARPVSELGLGNRPVILGEFSGRSPQVGAVLEAARNGGYEGALVWSVLAGDEQSAYPPDLAEWVRAER